MEEGWLLTVAVFFVCVQKVNPHGDILEERRPDFLPPGGH